MAAEQTAPQSPAKSPAAAPVAPVTAEAAPPAPDATADEGVADKALLGDAADFLREQAAKEPEEPATEGEAEEEPKGEPVEAEAEETDDKADEDETPAGNLKKLSKGFRALKRKTNALNERERNLEQREQDIRYNETVVQRAQRWAETLDKAEPQELIELAARRQGTTPTEMLRTLIAKLSGKPSEGPDLSKLEQKFEQRFEQLISTIEKKSQAEKQEQTQQFWADFADRTVQSLDEDRYPVVATFDTNQIRQAAVNVAAQYFQKTGKYPPPSDVLEYLEDVQTREAERKAAALAKKKNGTTTHDEPARPAVGAAPATQPAKNGKKPSRSVTNKDASERSYGAGEDLSERELIAAAAREVFGQG